MRKNCPAREQRLEYIRDELAARKAHAAKPETWIAHARAIRNAMQSAIDGGETEIIALLAGAEKLANLAVKSRSA